MKWKHIETYAPVDRAVFVDVFKRGNEFVKGQRKEFDMENSRMTRKCKIEDVVFPDDPNFELDWEWSKRRGRE